MTESGTYEGRPIFAFVEQVKELLREEKLDEAEDLLWHLIQATEAESEATRLGVAPWYYSKLANVYHKKGEYQAEVQVLERFSKQRYAPGVMPRKLIARLEKARQAAGEATPLRQIREETEDRMANLFSEWKKRSEEKG